MCRLGAREIMKISLRVKSLKTKALKSKEKFWLADLAS
jgi:hypothetical protein